MTSTRLRSIAAAGALAVALASTGCAPEPSYCSGTVTINGEFYCGGSTDSTSRVTRVETTTWTENGVETLIASWTRVGGGAPTSQQEVRITTQDGLGVGTYGGVQFRDGANPPSGGGSVVIESFERIEGSQSVKVELSFSGATAGGPFVGTFSSLTSLQG